MKAILFLLVLTSAALAGENDRFAEGQAEQRRQIEANRVANEMANQQRQIDQMRRNADWEALKAQGERDAAARGPRAVVPRVDDGRVDKLGAMMDANFDAKNAEDARRDREIKLLKEQVVWLAQELKKLMAAQPVAAKPAVK